MPNVFLAPRSNETSHENFDSTILGGRPYEFLAPYLTESEKKILSKHKTVSIWGNQESLRSRWAKMQPGDFVLFYAAGAFYYSARVSLTKFDRELASKLWPPGKSGKPWSCLFFVEDLKKIHIPIQVVQQLADYEPTWDRVQGFMQLRESGVEAIKSQFGSIERFMDQDPVFYEDIDRILERKDEEKIVATPDKKYNIEDLIKQAAAYRHEGPHHKLGDLSKKVRVENKKQKQIIAQIENYLCQLCGWSLSWKDGAKQRHRIDVDHIIDKADNGTEEMSNLWTLCPNCHAMKTVGYIKVDLKNHKIYKNGSEIKLKTDQHLNW